MAKIDATKELLQIGLNFHKEGNLDEAKQKYDEILSVDSSHFDALQLSAILHKQIGHYHAAIDLFNRALKIRSSCSVVLCNLGVTYRAIGEREKALHAYSEAIRADSNNAEAHYNLGNLYKDEGKLAEAISAYEEAIKLNPNHADAFYNKGNAHKQLRELNEAYDSYTSVIKLCPNHAAAINNRGNVLKALGRLNEALLDYNDSIQISPGYVDPQNNKATVLHMLGELELAIELYSTIIKSNPNFAEAHFNLANVLKQLKRFQEAEANYDTAIKIKADYPIATWNRSLMFLQQGRYIEGWSGYEARTRIKEFRESFPEYEGREWRGEFDLAGKRVMIYSEQGLGDTIQFVRYLPLVREQGALVTFIAPKTLVSLVKSVDPFVTVLSKAVESIPFDFHCPLLSLPFIFRTTLENLPPKGPYLKPDLEKVRLWKNRLNHIKQLKVGLVWNGGHRPNNLDATEINLRRNISLKIFSAYFQHREVAFFSLQKGEPAESEIKGMESTYWPKGNFFNFSADLNDFADTAALIANLDLIISVDTSTAHLSGAMGKDTWLLNRFDTCWRWLEGRNDSPWYPTLRIFRQHTEGGWEVVLKEVSHRLDVLSDLWSVRKRGKIGDSG